MRADADFMVFVAARWPALLREAVLMGCPPEQAADAVTDALSRCRRDWDRASREENVDHLVHEALVVATERRPSTDAASREDAVDDLLVLAPPTLDELEEHQRRADAAARRRAAMVVVPVLLLAAGAGVYATVDDGGSTPDGGSLEQAPVERVVNPAPGVVWYADGELHLESAVLEIDGITDMTRLGTGVVYGDDEGRVVYAADDGSRSLLGHKEPTVPVAATDENGLAAWFDPDTEKLHVVEAATGNVRMASEIGDRPEVVAVDGDVVYLVGADGARALLPTGPTSEVKVDPVGLLDVRSRIRVFQKNATTIQVVQSAFNASFDLTGRGADLSPDGTLVATRSPEDGGLLLYDTRSGVSLDTGLAPDERLLAAAPDDRGRLAYVVVPADGGDAELRTCVLAIETCTVVAEIPGPDDPPVLAR